MDVNSIKEYLMENTDQIGLLLEKAGFHNITLNNEEYRCGRDIDTNPTSVRVKFNLASVCFSTGIRGDIITLIKEKMRLSFRDTLLFIKGALGLSDVDYNKPKAILPFGGFYKNIGKHKKYDSYIEPLDKEFFSTFDKLPNKMFLDDGISIETQQKFEIMYDHYSHRVIIPYWDLNGNLIGAMGRYNGDTDKFKYVPVCGGFPKAKTLYGYWQNYSNIQNANLAIVGESEKFVMQLDSFGLPIGLALGGSMLSSVRVASILALQVDRVILAYDEGLDEELIIENAKMIKDERPFFKTNVGYIIDRENKYLPKGSKCSPTDLGKDVFKELLKNCVVWL